MYKIEVSASGHVWMTAAGYEDGFDTHDRAEKAKAYCEEADPTFQFRIVATDFGAYWQEVYGDMDASQVCAEYDLCHEDLEAWVTRAEVEAARQGNFANWEAIQAEWCALGFSARAYDVLETAAIEQAVRLVAS
jgi:hypothetical protein